MPSKRVEAAELNELAAAGASVQMRLDPGSLPRLAELVERDRDRQVAPTALDVVVDFDLGSEGHPRLEVAVTGGLDLRCQRCLQALAWPVRLATSLTVLEDDKQAERLTDPFDSVVMDADGLVLETIIEDEILAALPMAPVHEPEQCAEAGAPIVKQENEAGQTYRPFAALATMVGGGERKND